MSPHYETLDLVDYARGYLSGEDARELFGHCQGCSYCGSRLAAVMALREGNARERTAIVRRRWVAAAASGVVLIGLVAAGANLPGGAANVPAATSSAPELMGGPVLIGELAELAALAAPESLDFLSPSHIAFRFGALRASSDDWEVRLKAAAENLWAGNIEEALATLDRLHGERPQDAEVAAYFGIALYLSGDRRDDVGNMLLKGTGAPTITLPRTAAWYLANHYVRTGKPGRAAEILGQLAATDDDRIARAANELLLELPQKYR